MSSGTIVATQAACICMIAIFPLYKSYSEAAAEPTAAELKSLPTLLNTKAGHDAFCQFLQSEYRCSFEE